MPKSDMAMNELSTILGIIEHDLPAVGVEPLMIGGYAVNHYGYTRSTLDIDFMVATDQMDALRPILTGAGFINVSAMDNVVFFSAPDSSFRVDFLKVDQATMRDLRSRAVPAIVHGHTIRVPALEDLLAMKIFALAQTPTRRMAKDLPDITFLAVMNNVDIESLCKRFGNPEVNELIHRSMSELRKA